MSKKAKNLNLNQVIARRGFAVLREMGYEASEGIEKFLERLWEERRRIPKRQRGDNLQITFFDRVTEPEPERKKKS